MKQTPAAHISYHEGLRLIRQFLDYSSKHTVEEVQAFTSQFVPTPLWVRINDAEVAPKFLERAAKLIQAQLGNRGLQQVGGKTWWQWRRPESPLHAEWIEMKKEYHERKRTGAKCERVILYAHGGAYYFGSVDEHRYQMQRHARKMKARVLAPRYRLAPQYPFPCGLYDCLAAYFYLLEHFDPAQILFAGDSAGGGMVLSMLVTLRDQGQPLPAGTILLSPWVDLTHSFPSVAGDGVGDYIPPHGFHHKPSMAWPPPPSDEIKKASNGIYGHSTDAVELPATAGFDMKQRRKDRAGSQAGDGGNTSEQQPKKEKPITALPSTLPAFGHELSINLDGAKVDMKDQIQLYTTNELLAHPLVSPVMQPSLGGLPPMLIQVGGAELLRDEQIYLAHKAANPKAYPSNDTIMDEFDPQRRTLEKYPPTDVQLQVWDDLCHVPHTLSFTRPAKYMYRSVAQFGVWAFANAQHTTADPQDDDAVSIISSGDENADDTRSVAESSKNSQRSRKDVEAESKNKLDLAGIEAVGRAGDPIPPFKEHMIRQRVTRHGVIYALAPSSEMASLALDPASIGVIKAGPVRKWLGIKAGNDQRFANDRKKILKKRAKEGAAGYDDIPGECPPPTALVNRKRGGVAPEEKKKGKSWGLAMWSGWGSSHDEHTLQREQKTDSISGAAAKSTNDLTAASSVAATKKKRRTSSASMLSSQLPWSREKEMSRSPYSRVKDTGQTDAATCNRSPAPSGGRSILTRRTSETSSLIESARPVSMAADSPIPVEQDRATEQEAPIPTISAISPLSEKIPGSNNTFLNPTSSRPHNGVQAYPFKLRDQASNPSIATLDSMPTGTSTPASGSHSELAGDRPRPIELPSARQSDENLKDSSEDAAAAATTPAVTYADLAAMPGMERLTHPALRSPPKQWPRPDSEALGPDAPIVSPMKPSTGRANTAPTSPVEPPKQQVPLRTRTDVFDPRTSVMVGRIGADGMPNAHHDFTTAPTNERSASGDQPGAIPPSSDASNSAAVGDESPNGAKTTPFKLRNPVKDSRAATNGQTSENTAPSPTTKEAAKPTDPIKAAPFKLRHTLYEPSVLAKSHSPEEPISTQPANWDGRGTSPTNLPEVTRSRESSNDKPPAYESMPLTNIVMPETVASRPIARRKEGLDADKPPTPPPKDDKPYISKNKLTKSSKPRGEGDIPASKFSAGPPTIGNLTFEKRGTPKDEKARPPLESFVTASEGRELK